MLALLQSTRSSELTRGNYTSDPNLNLSGGPTSLNVGSGGGPLTKNSTKSKHGHMRPINTNQGKVAHEPRFLIVKRIDELNFDSVSPFLISKTMFGLIGQTNGIKKIKNGLLVETVSNAQSNRLKNIKMFVDFPVQVEPHNTLNHSKGVITCKDFRNSTIKEIKEGLQDEGVIAVKQIEFQRNGETIKSNNYILTYL